jgi:hypothetical protein
MTSQSKRFIELTDILALNFVCKDCGAAISVSPKEYLHRKQHGTISDCPICRRSWAQVDNASCELTVEHFVQALEKLAFTLGTQDCAFPAGFSLTLEVSTDPKP